jgi:hypothetical protein
VEKIEIKIIVIYVAKMPIKDKNARREYSRKWMQKKRIIVEPEPENVEPENVEPENVEPENVEPIKIRTIETQTDIIIKGNGSRFLVDKFDNKILWSWSLITR